MAAANPEIVAEALGNLTLERQTKMEQDMRHSAIQGITLHDLSARPDKGGSAGRRITVRTNMYAVDLKEGPKVFHYDVMIDPVQVELPAAQQPTSGKSARVRNERKLPFAIIAVVFELALTDAIKDPNNPLTRELVDCLRFDGRRNCYTRRPLSFTQHAWSVCLPQRGADSDGPRDERRKFTVTMREVNQIDMSVLVRFTKADPQLVRAAGASFPETVTNAIQALQIAICHDAARTYKVHGAGGRRFFDQKKTVDIPGGAQIWKGFFQSIRPTQAGIAINIDASYAAFLRSGNLRDVCAAILGMDAGDSAGSAGGRGGRGGFERGRGGRGGFDRGGRGRGGGPGGFAVPAGSGANALTNLRPMQQAELRKRLKDAKIKVTHRESHKIEAFKGFSPKTAREITFDSNSTTVHLVQYFQEKYGYTIRYPDLPCVVVANKSMYPMEVCEIVPGTPLPPRKLSGAQTSSMIDASRQRPDEKEKTVKEWRSALKYEQSPALKSWGMDVASQLMAVNARVLEPPTVSYGRGSGRVNVAAGGWNLRNAKFCLPGTALQTWAIVNFTRTPDQACIEFAGILAQGLRELGIGVNAQPYYSRAQPGPDAAREALNFAGREAKKRAGGPSAPPPQLFVTLVDGDAELYGAIKRAAFTELSTPVASQCLLARKALSAKGQQQYVANVAMKINVKLRGLNHAIENPRDLPGFSPNTMLMGADVSHAAPGSSQLSIADSVATVDGRRSKYHSELRPQRNISGGKSQEGIHNMRDMALEHLKRWKAQNDNKLPQSIVMFRDGVSEGQWAMARQHEAAAIKDAIHSLDPRAKIPLTYIVCMKRHNVRFFPTSQAEMDRSGNLPAGTVVDTQVVHPYGFDFYLQSHAGLIGTCRPTRYVVLSNEGNFTSDQLQKAVNSLCYTYCRATRAVSLVPPAYYADILAEKGRALMYADMSETATSLSDRTDSTSALQAGSDLPEPDSIQLKRSLDRDVNFALSQWYM